MEEYILKALRQREGLEEDDTSKDETFKKYSKKRIVTEYFNWHGLIDWGNAIISVVSDVYGLNLEDDN